MAFRRSIPWIHIYMQGIQTLRTVITASLGGIRYNLTTISTGKSFVFINKLGHTNTIVEISPFFVILNLVQDLKITR